MTIPDFEIQRTSRIPNSSIRKASVQDAGLLAFLIKNAFRDIAKRFELTLENCPTFQSNITASIVEEDFKKGVKFFIKIDRGIASGCVGVKIVDKDLCSLVHLGVLPGRQGQGFGKELVEKALNEARNYGTKQLNVSILSDDIRTKKWFKNLGFIEKENKEFDNLSFGVTYLNYPLDALEKKQ